MADRKTEILEATCRVIAREGADGLRMGTVAREAGVSSALLHYYFDTRADLLMQAFEHADDQGRPGCRGGAGRASRARSNGCERLLVDLRRRRRRLPRRLGAVGGDVAQRDLRRAAGRERAQLVGLVDRADRRPDRSRRATRGRSATRSTSNDVGDAAGGAVDGLGLQILSGIMSHERAARADQRRAGDRAGASHQRKERRMSVAGDTKGKTLPATGVHVARGLRGRDARGVPEVVELRLPRQRRGGAGEVLDDHRSPASRSRCCATTTGSCARSRTSAGTARPASSTARAAARRCCAAPTTAGRTAQDGQLAAVPEARGFDNLDREACRLPAFRVGELCGLVFVCMSDETEPLDTYFGDLSEQAGAAAAGRAAAPGPRLGERLRPQLEGDRRQLPGGLPHPGRPSRACCGCSTTSATSPRRQEPHLDRRAVPRQAVAQLPGAAVPAAAAADARASPRS